MISLFPTRFIVQYCSCISRPNHTYHASPANSPLARPPAGLIGLGRCILYQKLYSQILAIPPPVNSIICRLSTFSDLTCSFVSTVCSDSPFVTNTGSIPTLCLDWEVTSVDSFSARHGHFTVLVSWVLFFDCKSIEIASLPWSVASTRN